MSNPKAPMRTKEKFFSFVIFYQKLFLQNHQLHDMSGDDLFFEYILPLSNTMPVWI